MRPRALLLVVLLLSARAHAGSVTGQVQLLEKGGAQAGDLSDVVVYVDGVKGHAPKPATTTMAMKAKGFIPRVLAVPVGGTVQFPNEDPIFHNVFSLSPENRFDLELYKRPKSGSWTFKAPGIANLYCNIHPQMSAVVVVRDNPFYTMAGKDGSFTIQGVPAGRHKLVAWHERAGEVIVEVEVPAQGPVSASLTLDASQFKRVQHKNKFGKAYGAREKY